MKKLLVSASFWAMIVSGVFLPVSLSTTTVVMAQELGLKERRIIKDYQEKIYPSELKNIQDAAGFAVAVEPDWNSFFKADQAESFNEGWYITNVFFKPLVTALTSITSDSEGKEALKAKLTKIILKHDAATAPASAYKDGVTFKDGILTINFVPGSNADAVDDRATAIEDALSEGL